MNITDVDKNENKVICRLQDVFNRQKELMEKYHDIEKKNGLLQTEQVPVDINSHMGQQRLKDFAWRVTEEIGEAMNCLKNKPWKQTQMLTDRPKFKKYIQEAYSRLLGIFFTAGYKMEDIYILYFKKNAVNQFRQRSKY